MIYLFNWAFLVIRIIKNEIVLTHLIISIKNYLHVPAIDGTTVKQHFVMERC